MLVKPDLTDEQIVACVQAEYGLRLVEVAFLPLGADLNAAVYRACADDATPYFVKLRRGGLNETSVALPKFLADEGIKQIIAPFATKTGALYASLNPYKLILYPFVAGKNGHEIDMMDRLWIELGATLKAIHTLELPAALANRIPRETYSPQWRASVKTYLERVETDALNDPFAIRLAEFLKARRAPILDLVARAERLALALESRPPEFVLCHSDIHAGNVLIDAKGALYVVDWDNPILAPKERDLMFAGGAQFGHARTPQAEETLFYQGYGQTRIDPNASAYYRYERIVEDLASYSEQIFSAQGSVQDREQALDRVATNFLPNNTIEVAQKSDKTQSA